MAKLLTIFALIIFSATSAFNGSIVKSITGKNEKFQLFISTDAAISVFCFVDYVSKEVYVNKQTEINIEMQPDVQSLSEVVKPGDSKEITRV